ncbi:MAG: 3-dehydroquinate synthase [Cardiobacteriaceae bacterium]|nr:3-dehydroquinate synthase [Cardiobacteriaceae bacterium]
MIQLNVSLPYGKHYPIIIASGLHQQSALWDEIPEKNICIVTNATIAEHYLAPIQSALAQKPRQILTVLLEDGEQHKNLHSWERILSAMLEKRFGRDSLILALGGGIIGDIAGFAAASFQRGIPFIQIPTTLLAQVDSSVGGKTGVNHALGKNLIGAFHQPRAVYMDIDTLKTLPKQEFSAGMAEVIKYGLINDLPFFEWLEENQSALREHNPQMLAEMIAHCCQNKASIVERDETEQGERALLNLGHTFGHALEALTHYKIYKHGECVAIGMMMAHRLAHLLGWISENALARVQALLQAFQLPTTLPSHIDNQPLAPELLYQAMFGDKKVKAGKLRLIVPKRFGECIITDEISESLILKTITQSF